MQFHRVFGLCALAGAIVLVAACGGGATSTTVDTQVAPASVSDSTSAATALDVKTAAVASLVASTPYSGAPIAIPATIPAEAFDRGGEGVAYHDKVKGNAGGQYRTGEDVDIIVSSDSTGGGYVVNNFETGEWLAYTISVATTGQYDIDLRASSAFSTGAFHIEVDGRDVTGRVTVPNTGAWTAFQWAGGKRVPLTAGRHVLKLVADQQYFNLNSIRVLAAAAVPTPYSGSPIAVPATFEAENFDRGGEGVAYHDKVPGNAGGQYRTSEDVDIVASADPSDGTYVVNNFETGEWLTYTINVATSTRYNIELRASSALSNGAFHAEIDGKDVTGRITVPNSSSWAKFQWIGKSGVSLSSGKHLLKIVADQQYFDFTSVRVITTPSTPVPPPPPPAPTPPPPPAPPPPVPDPSTVLFSCTFVRLATDCGFFEQAKVSGRASIASIGRDGPTAVRLHTEPGDSNVNGSDTSERNDLATTQSTTDCYQGHEQWWAHSILFPDDYAIPPAGATWNWGVLLDFHHTGSTGQANFQIVSLPTGLAFQGFGGTTVANSPSDPGFYGASIGPVVKNVWYDFVYHVKWSSGNDGYFYAWVNGVKKLSHTGPTLYSGMGCYLKLANYHTPLGKSVSVIHDRVIRGTTGGAVALTPLQ